MGASLAHIPAHLPEVQVVELIPVPIWDGRHRRGRTISADPIPPVGGQVVLVTGEDDVPGGLSCGQCTRHNPLIVRDRTSCDVADGGRVAIVEDVGKGAKHLSD